MVHHRKVYQHQNDDADRRTERAVKAEMPDRGVPEICFCQRTGADKMIGFIFGTFFGSIVGMTATCLCVAAGQADRRMNCTDSEEKF